MTEVAVRETYAPVHQLPAADYYGQDPTGGRLVAWANSLSAAHQLASALCATSFVPKHFAGKPIEAAAALILGDELGFSPVSALRSIFVISGTPGLYAKAMVALVQSHGHEIWTETDTPTKVVVCGQRKGSTHVERSEWTPERARRAKYTSNAKYESDPQAMLYARAASDVARKVAADVLAGVPHSVEELELEAAQTAPTRVSRPKPQAVPMPEPDLTPPTDSGADNNGPGADRESAESNHPAPESPYLNTSSGLARRMFALFNEVGITDKDQRLERVSEIIGRLVTTSKEMTDADAERVIAALETDLAAPFADAEPSFEEQP
jgi:hypothetical protein